nr:hypothetical protein [Tanacetum cinerariifolium]
MKLVVKSESVPDTLSHWSSHASNTESTIDDVIHQVQHPSVAGDLLGHPKVTGARNYVNKLASYVGPYLLSYQEFRMTGPTPITPINRTNTNTDQDGPTDLQDQILSHVSSLKALVQKHNEAPTGLLKPIRLSFDNEGGPEEEHDEELEDLRKPYKEQTLDGPARGWFDRLLNGCINNWTDLREAFVERFALRRKCCKDPTKVAKIVGRANETLSNFKERWTKEMSYIPDVPVVMQISAFMSNSKYPELARRFSDQVPQTVAEIMRKVDDFVKSEEVFKNTELPKGEHPERPALKIALESEKLNHLIKDMRQRGGDRGRQTGNNNGRRKVINMVRQSNNGLKRKSLYKQSEEWMDVPITFPPVSTDDVSDGPLTVEAEVEGYWIRRARLAPTQTELVRFSGEQLIPIGKIELKVCFGEGGLTRNTIMKFTVVRASSPYNIILGRTGLLELWAISSTIHGMMTFPTPKGIATICARAKPIYDCQWSERKVVEQEETVKETEETRNLSMEEEEKVLVNPTFPEQTITIAQKRRVLGTEKSKVVTREVEEWVKAGIVRPVKYPTLISNPVLMFEEDEDKTIFYTDQRTYCYVKMPFGLKNVGATYQKLIDSAFWTQLGRNLEAYVDDMVIESKTKQDMIMDIAETFDNLRKISMKLNPIKCSFGIGEGKFMVTSERIRVNPKKTKEIADMQSLKTLKEMQSLRRLQMDRRGRTCIPGVKEVHLRVTTLTTLELKETLFVYLATSYDAISGVLVADRKGKQTPIRYVSRTLHEVERNYAFLDKLALCLLHLSRRLRRYFKAHPIKVITNQPIKQILNKPEVSRNLAKYIVELGAYNITYIPRTAVKDQILADFINEILTGTQHVDACNSIGEEYLKGWTLYTDEARSQKGVGVEYEALLAELRIARKMKVQTLDVQEVSTIVGEEEDNWMTPIIKCLEEGVWPTDENEARTLRKKIGQYVVEYGVLFKKSYLSHMLRCVGSLQANYIIREVHEGACGMHTRARFVVAKIMRHGYYWPTMHGDTKEVVDKCDSCHIHVLIPKLPKTQLTSIMSPWPFYQWGLGILGPLPKGPDKLKFIIVAIDYFTK